MISNAWAEPAASAPQGDGGLTFVILIVFILFFYFLILGPQRKKAKEHQAMMSALAKGDEVMTNGGILGKVMELGDNYVLMEVADNVQIKVQRYSINSLVPKGTIKSTL